MRAYQKAGFIVAGYVAAFVAALAVLAIYRAASGDSDDDGGMRAFGDSLLFLAAFGVAAIPATGLGFFFLRRRAAFWPPFSTAALCFSATAVLAVIDQLEARTGGTTPGAWSMLAVLRILVAPLGGGAYLLAALFSPQRRAMLQLMSAALIELAAFGGVLLALLPAPCTARLATGSCSPVAD